MSKNGFWYGFLEAGKKSTGILLDSDLDTGNKKTLYLYNLARERILEYDREHVEPRLRELSDEEQELVEALDASYPVAKADFLSTHENHRLDVPGTAPPKRVTPEPEIESEADLDDFDDSLDMDEPLEDVDKE